MVERQRAVIVIDGHQALVEAAFLDGDVGAALAFDGEFFRRAARDAFHRGDGVAADALMRLRMQRAQMQIARIHEGRRFGIGGRGGVAHHLGAAGDDEVFHAGHDLGGGHVHGGDARAAEAIQRHAAGLDVIAGIEGGHAAQIGALLAALGRGAPDDVVDLGGVEIVALGDRA